MFFLFLLYKHIYVYTFFEYKGRNKSFLVQRFLIGNLFSLLLEVGRRSFFDFLSQYSFQKHYQKLPTTTGVFYKLKNKK